MINIKIPYDREFLCGDIPEINFNGIYKSNLPEAVNDQEAEVRRALDEPVGSLPLEKLAEGKKSAVVITSDHTRPVPSKIMMPQILERLRRNSPDIDITILVSTGLHRATTENELISKLGSKIVENEKIVVHNASDKMMLTEVGTLPSGGKLVLNKLVMETELLVAEGFIEPHFFAGFSGGRKSILPGVASKETVMANHCSEFIQSPFARTGILENNPIHRDMIYAAEKANLAFILNAVIDGNKNIVRCFAGDKIEAHLAGCRFLSSCCTVKIPESDIIITGNGGYPLDQNVYQSVKGMTAGEAVCRENGVIIMVSACSEGHGGESFLHKLMNAVSPESLWKEAAQIPQDKTVPDQWQYQILVRILCRFTVIVVTDMCDHEMLRKMHFQTASSIDEALGKAFEITGRDAKVAVIPDGVSVIAIPENK